MVSLSIFVIGKLGFKLFGFKVFVNIDFRLLLGMVFMVVDVVVVVFFFFFLSWSFWMRLVRDCLLFNEVEDLFGSIYIYMKGC